MAGTSPLRKRVLRWGNSFGIRLTRSDLKRLDLNVDDEVDVAVKPHPKEIDWDALPRLSLASDSSVRHDQIIAEGIQEDHQ